MHKAFLNQRAMKQVKEDKILKIMNKENISDILEKEEDIQDHIQEEGDILDHIQEEEDNLDLILEGDIQDLILEEEIEIQENVINVIKLDI